MPALTLYYNPRCSKCREALRLLEEKGAQVDVINYLEELFTIKTLSQVLDVLGVEPQAIMRVDNELYKELGLDDNTRSRAELLDALVKNPALIQRPIAIKGNRGVVGRPPELVLSLL